MANAAELVRQFAAAGFLKIHIDTSMRLKGDPPALSDEVVAARAALLCQSAEEAADPGRPPVYVIGSEVPIPGGAQHEEEGVPVTRPEDFLSTVAAFRQAFAARGLGSAWERVVAVVVQPGVEFGDEQVFDYDRARAARLVDALKPLKPLVFEGHSTDYQTPSKLRQMAEDGVGILKVGPALTFAVREAMFALCEMEKWVAPERDWSRFAETLEDAMLRDPSQWQGYYHGTPGQQAFKRRFSLSDRARYYLAAPEVEKAAARLLANINAHKPPLSLVSQYMPSQWARLREGSIPFTAEALVKSRVADCLDTYPSPRLISPQRWSTC
jgi:D-tagatose-1,6-bisphosphate aldolase subunit GatZ/KbaZ